jgi:hypothetical protein
MLGERACRENQARCQETERDLKKKGSPTPHILILDLGSVSMFVTGTPLEARKNECERVVAGAKAQFSFNRYGPTKQLAEKVLLRRGIAPPRLKPD